MVRKRPLKERIIDSALLVISIVVIIFALAMMAMDGFNRRNCLSTTAHQPSGK